MVKGSGVDEGFDIWDTPLPRGGGWQEFSLFGHDNQRLDKAQVITFDTALALMLDDFCDNGDVNCGSVSPLQTDPSAAVIPFTRQDYPNAGLLFMFDIGYNSCRLCCAGICRDIDRCL